MNTEMVGIKTSKLWEKLGRRFADQIEDAVVSDEFGKAIILACCAEACFWKSTGEASAHDIKDVLPFFAKPV